MPATSCIVSVLFLAALAWATWAASGASGADAPDPSRATARATIDDLGWVVGAWRSTEGEAISEETWSHALGGAMVGTFRRVEASKPVFYEFLMLEEDAEGVLMRLRHFHPGMKSWESEGDAPQTLRLVERTATSARFQDVRPDARFALRYVVDGRALTVTLEGRKRDGAPFTTTFRFARA